MVSERFSRFRRRKFFIDKGLQSRFIIGFSAAVLAGFIINLALAYFLIDRELAERLYTVHVRVRSTGEIAGPVLWKLGAITVPLILAVSAAVGYLLTRRIEVPLASFRKSVAEVSEGDFTHRLKADGPGRLPEAFNRMTGSLDSSFTSVKRSVDVLDNSIKELASTARAAASREGEEGSGSLSSDLGPALDAVITSGAECRVKLSRFTA